MIEYKKNILGNRQHPYANPRKLKKYCPSENNTGILTNVIEVRWKWLQIKAIDNSTSRNQSDIGQEVQDWTENYNATRGRRINDILQIGVPLLCDNKKSYESKGGRHYKTL
jgi:hypothetical protein